jgi:hypothetical protein
VDLQINNSAAKTILAKQEFEKFAAKHGVRIQKYHCDNGQFSGIAFKQSCKANRQRLSFCGVNTHFQNRIAERAICYLSESAHKQLLHAWLAGQQWCILPFGNMPCAMLPFFRTACQCWRMEH